MGLGLVLVETLAWKGTIQLAPTVAKARMGFWKRSVLVALWRTMGILCMA